eukprot:1160832-Pelagomonas_calceolata.AAC.8
MHACPVKHPRLTIPQLPSRLHLSAIKHCAIELCALSLIFEVWSAAPTPSPPLQPTPLGA